MSKRILAISLLMCLSVLAFSEEKPKKGSLKSDSSSSTSAKKAKKKRTFDDSLKHQRKYEGLFTFYQDTATGALQMVIRKEQLNEEFIYFVYSENGLTSANAFRGNFRDNRIFTIKKFYNKIEFLAVNTNFYFNPSSPLSKASNGNINNSVLVSQKIIDTDPQSGAYLINADDILLGEILHRVKPNAPKGLPPDVFYMLGGFSRSKSKVLKIRNYPQNTDLVTEYVFENTHPTASAGAEVADDRNVSVLLQHSFLSMPKNNYKPRYDDPRVGYFTTPLTDMTSPSATPYRDMIHRWHLEKQDSLALVSDPKEPIVWWLEKTTPIELRPIITDAVLQWNSAFEKAGIRNAIKVFIQPDSATWDAGDIRYNVIRWTSSPNPIFGGYGPSFVNPRTGQILGADIMLEYIFLTNRLRFEQLFTSNTATETHICNLATHLQHSCMFGQLVTEHMHGAADTTFPSEFIKQAVYYLVLHEVGHTLGLNHNMRASQMLSPEALQRKQITSVSGITASVMDYPAVNISPVASKQTAYFSIMPGPYDDWAIQYGYSVYTDSIAEIKGLSRILARSTEPALAFGNDADDMRSPGVHIDPRVMIHDLSSDPVRYMSGRIVIANSLAGILIHKYRKEGKSYQELRNAYGVLTSEIQSSVATISRYVGGVYVDRSFVGQNSKNKPFTPVPFADQKKAFNAIATLIFSPEAFKAERSLYPYLQLQRRGFGFMAINEDPKIHERVMQIQRTALDHWMHPAVLKRLTDTELYGNSYTCQQFLTDLTDAIFKADFNGTPNTFRMQLQTEYVQRLCTIVKVDLLAYDGYSKALCMYQLQQLEKKIRAFPGVATQVQAHRNYLVLQIQKALAVKQ